MGGVREEQGGKRGGGGEGVGRQEEGEVFFFVGAEEGRESHLPSIFTGSELLNWELELERVPKTLQIQLHLERVDKEREGGVEGKT